MIGCLIVVGLAFAWLGYETEWMTVRLLVGLDKKRVLVGNSILTINTNYPFPYRIIDEAKKSQEPTKPRNPYPISHYPIMTCFPLPDGYIARQSVIMQYFEPKLEASYNGKPIISVNGEHKRGMIKDAVNSCYIYKQGKMKITPY